MIDQNIHDRIQARIVEVIKTFAKAGYSEQLITYKIASFKNEKGHKYTAGMVRNGSTTEFEISKEYLEQHTDEVIKVTVVHEISHLYVHKYYPNAKQSHGPEFRHFMSLMDLKGDTYHTMVCDAIEATKKTRTIYRYVYVNSNNQECKLTTQQHNKLKENPNHFKFNGLPIKFTGTRLAYDPV